MRKQPDFRGMFYGYFGSIPRKVTYAVRHDSNRCHDLVFLKSLIHDASFSRRDIEVRGKRLVLQLSRDCWELGLVRSEGRCETYTASSRLSMSPVDGLEWRFRHGREFQLETELMIHDVLVGEGEHGCLSVVIDGIDWSLHMKAAADDFMMRLQDLETPYLFSRKHGVEGR